MAVFRLAARDGSVTMVVRARCMTCAQQVAVAHAGPEGRHVWATRQNCTVELVWAPEREGYVSDGPDGVIERIEHD